MVKNLTKGVQAKAFLAAHKMERELQKVLPEKSLREIYLGMGIPEQDVDTAIYGTYSIAPAVFQTVVREREDYTWEYSGRYARYREMLEIDGELRAAVDDFAFMIEHAFNAIVIHPGHEMSAGEENTIKLARDFGDHLDIGGCFYACGNNILQDGDIVIAIRRSRDPWELVFLPMDYITAVQSLDQIGDDSRVVTEANYYILNEQNLFFQGIQHGEIGIEDLMEGRDYYYKDDIIHISWNNKGSVVKDNYGRTCYNVWSMSRLQSIKKNFEWKMNMSDIDITWRNKMLPRLHHKINMESYAPEKFSGPWETKLATARTAGQKVLSEYAENSEYKHPDQDHITGDAVNISVIEPQSTTYHAPNELFEYFIAVYCAITGTPKAALKGESQGSYAAELLINQYASMRAEILAKKIGRHFTKFIREYLNHVYEQDSKALSKKAIESVEVQVNLMFNKDFRELGRFISLLAASGILTQDELRKFLGFLPLTDEEQERLVLISGANTVLPGSAGKELSKRAVSSGGGRRDPTRTPQDSKGHATQGGKGDYPEATGGETDQKT